MRATVGLPWPFETRSGCHIDLLTSDLSAVRLSITHTYLTSKYGLVCTRRLHGHRLRLSGHENGPANTARNGLPLKCQTQTAGTPGPLACPSSSHHLLQGQILIKLASYHGRRGGLQRCCIEDESMDTQVISTHGHGLQHLPFQILNLVVQVVVPWIYEI